MKSPQEEVKQAGSGVEVNGKFYDNSVEGVPQILALMRVIEAHDVEVAKSSSKNNSDHPTKAYDPTKPLLREKKEDHCLTAYFKRWQHKRDAPYLQSTHVVVWSWIGSFLGIAVLCYIHYEVCLKYTENLIFIVGSFGAQAVLLFAAPKAPLAQPWNAVVGNGVSAFAGICAWHIVGEGMGIMWLAGAFAVSIAIVFMHWTNSLHPPGGATALIAVMEMKRVHELSFLYILFPAVLASMVHVAVALLVNNISADPLRSYPMTWIPFNMKPKSS
mmetsp:Transcript_24380/g.45609  ORF Transcript_24380/g.45609 Transcript_24380/m.45609 type:complete len:273 (-) Transcript_24380:143-961(-)